MRFGGNDVRSKAQVHRALLLLIGGVAGLGLAVPYALGEPVEDQRTAATGSEALGELSPLTHAPSANSPSAAPAEATATPVPTVTTATTAPAPAAAPGEGGRSLTATDVGVTARTITLGVVLPNAGGFSRVPGFSESGYFPDEFRAHFDAYLAAVNATGGIGGRTLVAAYREVALNDPESSHAACVFFTQEARVFAVVNAATLFLDDAAKVCVARTGTPLLDVDSEGHEVQSTGRVVSLAASRQRELQAVVAEYDRIGAFAGKKLAIVYADLNEDEINRWVVGPLEARGHSVAYRAEMSGTDTGQFASQIAVHVNQMKARGIQTVLLDHRAVANALFVQAADQQGYRPHWLMHESLTGVTPLTAMLLPAASDVVGLTSERLGEVEAGQPEPPYDAGCMARHRRHARIATPARGSQRYSTVATICTQVDVFAVAARGAGEQLTRQGWLVRAGLAGRMSVGMHFDGSLGPAKLDLQDSQRLVRFDGEGRRWVLAGTPRPYGATP